MPLVAGCPRCRADVETGTPDGRPRCPVHGDVARPLWRPDDPAAVSYDAFADHLGAADGFPTYLPWPMSPGWSVTDFAVAAGDRSVGHGDLRARGPASSTDRSTCSWSPRRPGTGLGSRCAGIDRSDPGREVGEGQPTVRVRIGSQTVPLWVVSTATSDDRFDRSVFAGEADGRWLWLVMRPASAMLLLRDDWILRDVSSVGPPLVEMQFGGPAPVW